VQPQGRSEEKGSDYLSEHKQPLEAEHGPERILAEFNKLFLVHGLTGEENQSLVTPELALKFVHLARHFESRWMRAIFENGTFYITIDLTNLVRTKLSDTASSNEHRELFNRRCHEIGLVRSVADSLNLTS